MKKTEYLVIEIGSFETSVSRFNLPAESSQFELVASSHGRPEDLPKMLDRVGLKAAARIIISFDHSQSATLRMPIVLSRSEAKVPITETELENLVSRGLWKIFNQRRHAGAVKMKVEDIAVKVADADILAVKLDGHRVLDPVGWNAREIELQCEETLVAQTALNSVLQNVPEEQIVSLQEAPAAWPILVRLSGEEEDFLALAVLRAETVLYRYANEKMECVDTLAWGSQDILKAVGAMFGLAQDDAQENVMALIDLYRAGRASPAVLKKMEAAISQELAILFKGIEAHRPEQEIKRIFISSQFRLPEELLGARYLRKLDIHFAPTLLNQGWISEKFGYTLKLNESEPADATDLAFAVLSAHHSQHKDAPLSKIAKRRARWL